MFVGEGYVLFRFEIHLHGQDFWGKEIGGDFENTLNQDKRVIDLTYFTRVHVSLMLS